jgi:hypothetical protein
LLNHWKSGNSLDFIRNFMQEIPCVAAAKIIFQTSDQVPSPCGEELRITGPSALISRCFKLSSKDYSDLAKKKSDIYRVNSAWLILRRQFRRMSFESDSSPANDYHKLLRTVRCHVWPGHTSASRASAVHLQVSWDVKLQKRWLDVHPT